MLARFHLRGYRHSVVVLCESVPSNLRSFSYSVIFELDFSVLSESSHHFNLSHLFFVTNFCFLFLFLGDYFIQILNGHKENLGSFYQKGKKENLNKDKLTRIQ